MADEEFTYMEAAPGQECVYQLPTRMSIPFDHRLWGELVQPWLDAGNTLLPYDGPPVYGRTAQS